MPKQIKEFQLDNTTGNISVEYDDNSTNKFNAATLLSDGIHPNDAGQLLLVNSGYVPVLTNIF